MDTPKTIHAYPGLKALPDELRDAAVRRTLGRREHLFRLGARPRFVFYVLRGEVRLIRHAPDGSEVILQRCDGGFLAEASMDAPRYHCDALAVESTSLLGFPVAAFRQALNGCPEFREAWMSRLAAEVRRLRAQSERLSLNSARERVIHYIESEGKDGAINLRQSRKAWAHELGLSHEALYRTLSRLRSEGVLRIDGKRIAVIGDSHRPLLE